MELIVPHLGADFDAFAAALVARRARARHLIAEALAEQRKEAV
jgi:hypothetical protein